MKTLYQMYNSTVLQDNSAESLDEVPRSIALWGYSNQNKNVNNTLNSISLRSSNDGIVPPTKNSKWSCKEQLAKVLDKFEDMRSYFEHQISTLEVNTMAKHKSICLKYPLLIWSFINIFIYNSCLGWTKTT